MLVTNEPVEALVKHRTGTSKRAVVRIGQIDEGRQAWRLRRQCAPEGIGHDIVIGAMRDEERAAELRDPRDRVIFAAQQPAHRQPRIARSADICEPGKGRLKYQSARAVAGGEGGRNSAAERTSVDDHVVGGNAADISEIAPGGFSIKVKAAFARCASTQSITTIIDDQYGVTKTVQRFERVQAVGKAAAVAVQKKDMPRIATVAGSGQIPAMDRHPIRAREFDIFEGNATVSRVATGPGRWVIDQSVLQSPGSEAGDEIGGEHQQGGLQRRFHGFTARDAGVWAGVHVNDRLILIFIYIT